MDDKYFKHYSFAVLMVLSLICGVIFFGVNHLDFIIAALQYNKLNVPNIAYILSRLIISLLVPLIFIVPSIFPYGRIKTAKWAFIAYGICHLLTLSWLIYFFIECPAMDIFNQSKVFEFIKSHDFIYFPTIWDNFHIASSIFAVILGLLSIYVGKNFDKHRTIAPNTLLIMLALRVALPIVYNIFFQNRVLSLYWITNNYLELLSIGLFTVAILIVSTSSDTWVELVWDQIVVEEEE